jgi:hypothetical protein
LRGGEENHHPPGFSRYAGVPAQRGVIRLISVTLLCDVDHADCGLAIGQ